MASKKWSGENKIKKMCKKVNLYIYIYINKLSVDVSVR